MTANQIALGNLRETRRSNLAKEYETHRSNVAKERETSRHNIADESETKRHNLMSEYMSVQSISETARHNKATEGEAYRHNVATEGIQSFSAQEVRRHNLAQEQLGYSQLSESVRHNQAQEGIEAGKLEQTSIANQLAIDKFTNQVEVVQPWELAQMEANIDKVYADPKVSLHQDATDGTLFGSLVGGAGWTVWNLAALLLD